MPGYNLGGMGKVEDTVRVVSGDVAATLSIKSSSGAPAVGALITCEDNDVRIALGGTTASQGASGVGHILYATQSLRITGPGCNAISYINETNGSDGVLQITAEYEFGK